MLSTNCVYKSYLYLMHIYKNGLVLNNQQRLICNQNQTKLKNQTKPNLTVIIYRLMGLVVECSPMVRET